MAIDAEQNDYNAACPDCTLVVAVVGLDEREGIKSNVQVRLEPFGQTPNGRPRKRLTVQQLTVGQQNPQ